jgi:hypothetical protein
MCKNAPPINAPAEKPTRQKRIFCNNLPFIAKVKMPISEIRLTMNVLVRTQAKIMKGV